MTERSGDDTDDAWLPWIRLSLSDGIGRIRAGRLLERYGSPEAVLSRPERELVEAGKMPAGVAAKLVSPLSLAEARNELARIRRLGVRLAHIHSDRYPDLLEEVTHPPVVIGSLGSLANPGDRAIAIVGSRNASARAIRAAYDFARETAEAGVVVVSGLARGIDRAAHEGALAAKDGRTIAVLGCGLARVYPAEHARLAARIRERGALMSEFPVDARPLAAHFPMRNRIIAGMSVATVVIAAGDRSGALITARYAVEAHREVFAVPGSVEDPLSRGTNRLIKDSTAHLAEGALDVLLKAGFARPTPGSDDRPLLRARAPREPLIGVPGEIEAFLESAGRICTFDEIVYGNEIDARTAMAALGFLALKRRVREIPGAGYALAD